MAFPGTIQEFLDERLEIREANRGDEHQIRGSNAGSCARSL
jgi:hypothetical protein